ncbi:MAG TPA: nucleotidyltransferase [Thermotogaceae bacterium]|nr:nucleotidyltransferase [Thermotogota bacterium]HEW92614.1 nucleotidyltransferase [Thermotogaceae bacterium]
MRVLGIIVEYNPFHYGHLYHLRKSIEKISPDYVVAVMSGNFVQRGEPSIIDKFARAEIALKSGVDIVIELPLIYSIQDAGGFAIGAVGILERFGVITDIVFGSESAREDVLEKIANITIVYKDQLQKEIRKGMKMGLSFPNARKMALKNLVKKLSISIDPSIIDIIENSNDILGLEYIRALNLYNSKIKFSCIKRVGAKYSDEEFKGRFSSASAVRKMLELSNYKVLDHLPEISREIIKREFDSGRGPIFYENMAPLVLGIMRTMERKDFSKFYGFVEGLDQRFSKFSRQAANLKELLELVKSKRFTFTKLRRLSLYPIFKITEWLIKESNRLGPQYIRVLGFTTKGRELLAIAKKKSSIPLISTPSLYEKVLLKVLKSKDKPVFLKKDLYIEQFKRDVMATNIYSLFYKNPRYKKGERDMRIPVIQML